jgi:hypothetical protein
MNFFWANKKMAIISEFYSEVPTVFAVVHEYQGKYLVEFHDKDGITSGNYATLVAAEEAAEEWVL